MESFLEKEQTCQKPMVSSSSFEDELIAESYLDYK
jgi:hypothetical protein